MGGAKEEVTTVGVREEGHISSSPEESYGMNFFLLLDVPNSPGKVF